MPLRLGELHDPRGDLAHLPDRAGRARELGASSVCTESITQTSGRSRCERRRARARGRSRRGPAPPARCAGAGEPLGAQPHLLGRLLAADVQRAAPGALRGCASTMFVSVDLPIPGEPPSSTSEPGHEPAAEHAVELADARRHARAARSRRPRQRPRARRARRAGAAGARRAAPRARRRALGRRRSSTSVFHASQPGHRPCHWADCEAALRADVDGRRGHRQRTRYAPAGDASRSRRAGAA